MKRMILVVLTFIILLAVTAALSEAATGDATVPGTKPKVVVLATGGTIAGVGDPGKSSG